VRAEMARHRVAQNAVAAHLGLSQTAISKRLAGTVPFDINELTRTAELLGVDLADLLPRAEKVTAA
jgi:transcriptional regulator with XRE-family HTH domain